MQAITNVHRTIAAFFNKSNSFITAFKDKVSELIHSNLFCSAGNIKGIHEYIMKTKIKAKQNCFYINEQIALKN